jgi:outer membrane protein OmpA-like peptidoglycan-associated protein
MRSLIVLGGLAALLLVGWFAIYEAGGPGLGGAKRIERNLQIAASGALTGLRKDMQFGWPKVRVDGRDAILTGEAPDPNEKIAVIKAVAAVDGIRVVRDRITTLAAFSSVGACQKAFNEQMTGKTILFDTGSTVIKPASKPLLDALAVLAKRCPSMRVEIAAHTDNTGDDEVNQKLSQGRADEVKKQLTRRGVPAKRLLAKGYGATKPVADNDSEDGKAKNRRIEFKISEG